MLIPAPTAVARPTKRAACDPDSRAAAKIGASVDNVPSISPTRPGWTYLSTSARSSIPLSLAIASVMSVIITTEFN